MSISGFDTARLAAETYALTESVEKGRAFQQGSSPVEFIPRGWAAAFSVNLIHTVFFKTILQNPAPIISNIFNLVASVAMIPLSYALSAAAKGKTNYSTYVGNFVGEPGKNEKLNSYLPNCMQIPSKISKEAVKKAQSISKHAYRIMQGALLVQVIAIAAFGSFFVAGAMLAPLVFQIADKQLGIVPLKVSLFAERFLPVVCNVIYLFSGSFFLVPLAILDLAVRVDVLRNYLFKIAEKGILMVQSKFLENCNAAEFVSLADCMAPISERTLTKEEIKEIMRAPDCMFSINQAHLTKAFLDLSNLPRDDDFSKLLTWFDELDWESQCEIILGKWADDDNVVTLLQEKFPDEPIELQVLQLNKEKLEEFNQILQDDPDLKDFNNANKFSWYKREAKACIKEYGFKLIQQLNESGYDKLSELYLNKLLKQEGLTKEAYAAMWLRGKMEKLIKALQGEGKELIGEREYIEEAIENAKLVIPYLEDLKNSGQTIFLMDDLMKLAGEGGEYCTQGIWRALKQLADTVVNDAEARGDFDIKDPDGNENIKQKIFRKLLAFRRKVVGVPSISGRADAPPAELVSALSDIHVASALGNMVKIGLLPFEDGNERLRVNVGTFCYSAFAGNLYRRDFLSKYRKHLAELLRPIVTEMELIELFRREVVPTLELEEQHKLLGEIYTVEDEELVSQEKAKKAINLERLREAVADSKTNVFSSSDIQELSEEEMKGRLEAFYTREKYARLLRTVLVQIGVCRYDVEKKKEIEEADKRGENPELVLESLEPYKDLFA